MVSTYRLEESSEGITAPCLPSRHAGKISALAAPLLSAVAMTALPPADFSPARGTAHASIEPLSCSLLIPLRYALRLPG